MKNLFKLRRQTLEMLSKSGLIEGFYLTGGAALATRYNHRLSEDLDFFTIPELSEDNFPYRKLVRGLSRLGKVIKQVRGAFCPIEAVINGIRVSFLSYPYPLLDSLETFSVKPGAGVICITSDKDIACCKAMAIARRGSKKDFYDLYFLMIKHSWNVRDLIKFYCQKYNYNFEHDHVTFLLKSLTHFAGAERQAVYLVDGSPLPEEK